VGDLRYSPIRVLTVKPPWPEAIAYSDKRTENRRQPTYYRGLVAIHSGRSPDWYAPLRAWEAAGLKPPEMLGITQKAWVSTYVSGAIIAVAELTGCHAWRGTCDPGKPGRFACTPWAACYPGTWHWELAERVFILPEPVPWRGMLGLKPLTGDAEKAVREQLEAVRG
jgi:hypothetical protein